ncbi:LacI family DNA-binding transcriptional regulator [Salegentibacter sp. BDJ18]|uniref:LacI family DNA-binding transcriptional regulator n=1 Tax=Salegentibacter sp. BDJ18 TaxID=2816376 RepID=UPI001AAEE729|nr:LacI family DNA-binding transcriptional regulator [Salegentibacter sp. BDJ18]MBO2543192.1 LacI family DNA-binding transcriptional regulator [Salegentibacter sp. BDJ18]
MKKTTIYEIAKSLGIDSSTVSRALNDSPRVSKKTKVKVLDKAKELGYSANLLASNLRNKKSNTIGVVVPRISRYFFSTTIAGIEEAAFSHGYNVIISQSLEQLEREKKIIDNFVSNRVDGVLISISWETQECDHLKKLQNLNMPLVFFDRHCSDIPNSNKVLTGDFQGAYQATEHLIKKGCKKIAHFSGPQTLELYKNRLKGYKLALEDNNMKFDPILVHESSLLKNFGYDSMKILMKNNNGIDGVFSANDAAAVGAIKFLTTIGKKVPEDIAFVGFSNDPLSEVVEPSLTTVDQFGFEMGKKACELLIENINSKNLKPQEFKTIELQPTLIERLSSQKQR